MRLTRKKSEERKEAVLSFFLKNPAATGDEAQAALVSGKLTGEKGPEIATGMLYELKKQASSMRAGLRQTDSAAGQSTADQDLAELRARARELQGILARLDGIAEVSITSDGATVRRVRREPL